VAPRGLARVAGDTDARSPECELSVVVPTYDRPAQIRRLLGQLEAQTLSPSLFEVIVVDDGSPVEVAPTLSRERYRYPLSVERQENAGSAAARQRGAERARGRLLVFVDDDMHVGPGWLQSHLNAHRSEDRLVVLGRRRAGSPRSRLPLIERYRLTMGDRLADGVSAGRIVLSGEYMYTGNVSMPRALFEEVGGFDAQLREICDAELGIRLEQVGARFVLSEEAFNVHERDAMSSRQWLDRGMRDGVYWSRVGARHPGTPTASPWHWLDEVNPVSRPLLMLSAVSPGSSAVMARVALASASAAGAVGAERVAMAGATFVYGVQMFRGVGSEAGSARAALREYRQFRQGFAGGRPGRPAALRELVESIAEDHRMLAETTDRYDMRHRDVGSPAEAFIVNIGFQLVVGYRVMRCLRELGMPLSTRIAARALRHAYGADLHWDAELAPGLVLVHGFGLAVSHAARTGHGCILYQNVTLGEGRDPVTGAMGAPHLQEDVVVGPGAALSGPIVVGSGSKIMANCTVSESVPAQTVVEAPANSMRPVRRGPPQDRAASCPP
jgi:serine acetyltransferase/GT2 family glycosyltransferase